MLRFVNINTRIKCIFYFKLKIYFNFIILKFNKKKELHFEEKFSIVYGIIDFTTKQKNSTKKIFQLILSLYNI